MNYACAGHIKVGRYMGVHVMEQTSDRFNFVSHPEQMARVVLLCQD